MIRYTADELFKMAESLETWGESFYSEAAKAFPEGPVRTLLSDLASWERRHKTRFHDLREALPESAAKHPDPALDDDPDLHQYIHTMMHGKVFPEDPGERLPELLGGEPDEERVISFALDCEKNTITFFLSMERSVPAYWGRDRIRDIVNEELRHVHLLSRQLQKLTDTPEQPPSRP